MSNQRQDLDHFHAMYPHCSRLGLIPAGDGSHPGYDSLELSDKLGEVRFAALMSGVKSVFVCNHRKYPDDHSEESMRGTEVHCVYAADVEKFLASEKGV